MPGRVLTVVLFFIASLIAGLGGVVGSGSSAPHAPIMALVADDVLLPAAGS